VRSERLDLDARAAKGGAPIEEQIAGGVTRLAVGDADELVFPRDRELDAHFEDARKVAQAIIEVFRESPGEFIA
jgi:hypothetical protein